VSQNGIKMGGKAAKMLIDRLENEDEEDEHYTELKLSKLI
jgi:LacI family transcriptional regulator